MVVVVDGTVPPLPRRSPVASCAADAAAASGARGSEPLPRSRSAEGILYVVEGEGMWTEKRFDSNGGDR